MLQCTRAFSALEKQSHVVGRAPATADRLVDEISNCRLLDPTAWVDSTYVCFDTIIGVVDGASVYGYPIQVDLVPMQTSNTDGEDNNGDGVVDEGCVRIWGDLDPTGSIPGAEHEVAVIGGHLQKDGLLFTRLGNMLEIEMTFADATTPGEPPTIVTLTSGVVVQD